MLDSYKPNTGEKLDLCVKELRDDELRLQFLKEAILMLRLQGYFQIVILGYTLMDKR